MATKKKRSTQGRPVGFLESGDNTFVLPQREIEELERRGEIEQADAGDPNVFIRRREARIRAAQEFAKEREATQKGAEEVVQKGEEVLGKDKTKIEDFVIPEDQIAQAIAEGRLAGTGEVSPVTAGDITSVLPVGRLAGLGVAAGAGALATRGAGSAAARKAARAGFRQLSKSSFELFGYNVGVKEIIVGTATAGQAKIQSEIGNINTRVTALGTEKNEKVQRLMFYTGDADAAIEVYRQDIEALEDARKTLQLLKIFSITDWFGSRSDNIELNIDNQITGKLSRIQEAEAYKAGVGAADIRDLAVGDFENEQTPIQRQQE